MHGWFDRPEREWKPLVLTNPSLDLAVAWGAAYYAWLRRTGGKRIGGGIARSYYIGIDTHSNDDAPELRTPNSELRTVLCVVPQHLEEEREIELKKPELELALGQPVAFPLYTSTVRGEDKAGDVLHVAPEQLLQLPPLQTVLRGGKRSGTKSVPVTLAARSTAIGTLEIFCVAKEGDNRWRLEFNVRDLVKEPASAAESAGSDKGQRVTDVWPEHLVQAAATLIRRTFTETAGEKLSPQELTKALESTLEAPRPDWPTGLCRRLWDFFAEVQEGRAQSPRHMMRWYNLAGFVLRPGFGDPLDRFRIEQLWKMLTAPPRKSNTPRLIEGGADYWIMWRRASGGLNGSLQHSLFDRLRPALLPGKGKMLVKPNANELAEMWRAAASLERLDAKHKQTLGEALLKPLKRSPVPTYGFWALTRLGARALLYGPLNTVVHHQVVESWLDSLASFAPGHQSEKLAWAFCLAQLARRTGQRALDIDDSHRKTVIAALQPVDVPQHWKRMVEEVIELEAEEQGQMLGDALPIGLRLVQAGE